MRLDIDGASPHPQGCAAGPTEILAKAYGLKDIYQSTLDFLEDIAQDFQNTNGGQRYFRDGTAVPLGVQFVQETTIFREFGPLAGNTMRLGYTVAEAHAASLRSSRELADDATVEQRILAALRELGQG